MGNYNGLDQTGRERAPSFERRETFLKEWKKDNFKIEDIEIETALEYLKKFRKCLRRVRELQDDLRRIQPIDERRIRIKYDDRTKIILLSNQQFYESIIIDKKNKDKILDKGQRIITDKDSKTIISPGSINICYR